MPESSRSSSRNTCLECRHRKRACDKTRPSCLRCQRAGRVCVYGDDGPTGSVEEFRRLQAQVDGMERTLAQKSTASPTAISESESVRMEGSHPAQSHTLWNLFFLDFSTFVGRQCRYPASALPTVTSIVDAIGEEVETQVPQILDCYFSTVHHSLFPMMSAVRLERRLHTDLKGDMALLLLCMKLVTSDSVSEGDAVIKERYQLARSCCMNSAPDLIPSLELLQATILVAFFELGHSMYPAAFLSVGYIVAMSHTMGLESHPSSSTMLGPPQNSTELEERKRTYWAVLVLDRFTIIGGHGRPLQTREPGLEKPLPCDDSLFNAGEFAPSSTLGAIQSATSRQSSSARTCQVVHLLGRVKMHLDEQEINKAYYGAEGLQLHRTVTALATAIEEELERDLPPVESGLWSSMGLCYSTLFLLHEAHCHTPEIWVATSEHQEMQMIAVEGLRKGTRAVASFARRLKTRIEQSGSTEVGIFACECIFAAGATCVWYVGETGDAEASGILSELRDLLQVIQVRWKCAATMIEVLHWEEQAFIA